MTSDLQLDLDALAVFADDLDRVRGQWDGSAQTLDPPIGLGGSPDLTGVMADFSQTWARAATSIDTFITSLSAMCRDTVTKFQSTDHSLATALDGPRVVDHRGYEL